MIKFFSLFLAFLTIVPTTIEQESFMETINDCYEQYIYAIDEDIEFGHVTIAIGTHKDKYYISAFLLSESSLSPNIYIYVNDKVNTCVAEGTIANAYGIKVDKDDTLKISFGKEPQLKTYELSLTELIEELNTNPLSGNGTGDFPSNKRESFFISMLKYMLIGFGIFLVGLIILLVIIIKRGKSIFNRQVYYNNNDYNNYDNTEGFSDQNVIDATFEEKTDEDRQALMDKYFEEYRSGDITEEELNEKLKKLWWKNE